MSKLTLPILCAYLPHGLEIINTAVNRKYTLEFGHLKHLEDKIQRAETNNKLLLRPLSSLTKPITHNGVEVIPFHVINDMLPKGAVFPTNTMHDWTGLIFFRKHTDFPEINIEWELIEKIRDFLLSLHFDLWNLLESGDALPIEEDGK